MKNRIFNLILVVGQIVLTLIAILLYVFSPVLKLVFWCTDKLNIKWTSFSIYQEGKNE